jgi:hypothetical protein
LAALCAAHAPVRATPPSPPLRAERECAALLPRPLEQALGRRFPAAAVLTLEQLDPTEKSLFTQQEGPRCPGVVHLDFFGDRTDTYGIVIVTGDGDSRRALLVLASRRRTALPWQLQTLESFSDPGLPTLTREQPGLYEDVYGEKTIRARGEALLLVGWESWAILYAWTGKTIDKVWLAD